MTTHQAGQYAYEAIASLPEPVAALLSGATGPLTKPQIAEMFLDHDAGSISFANHAIAPEAEETLTECISKSMTLTALSFQGVASTAEFKVVSVLAAALAENLSVQRVDVSGCGLTAADAKVIAEQIVPWNRTVIDWNFSGNAALGDEGVNAIVDAMRSATSSVQHVSFKGCGVADLAPAVKALAELTGLYQLDVSGNQGFGDVIANDLTELDSVLVNNLKLLHPNDKIKQVPLWKKVVVEDPADQSASDSKPADDASKQDAAAAKKDDGQARRGRAASRKEAASPPPRQRAQSTTNNSGMRRTQSMKKESPKKEEPAAKTEEKVQPAADAKKDDAQSPPPKRAEPEQKKAPPPQQQQQRQSRSATPQRQRSQSAQPAPRSPSRASSVAAQRDINDGYEEWKRKRDEYNKFIRAEGSVARTASPARGPARPKYVLGKRVEDKPLPSAAFKSSFIRTRERAPTPAEIRKLAPWNQQGKETHVGSQHRVTVDEGGKPSHVDATVITFVDGGKQTYIEDDPRDIGYVARKVQTGAIKPTDSLFKSQSARELRFGVTPRDKAYVQRDAQAPGPGMYRVKSDWERNAERLRQAHRPTSASLRPLFGSSAAPRAKATAGKDTSVPGPGEYEIP